MKLKARLYSGDEDLKGVKVEADAWAVTTEKGKLRYNFNIQLPDGGYVEFQLSAAKLLDAIGEVEGKDDNS